MKRFIWIFVFSNFLFPVSHSFSMTLEELKKQYDKHVGKLQGDVDVSFHVEQLGVNNVIYSYNANNPLIPASGMKIITSATALDQLGPSWTTHTQVLEQGTRNGNQLNGDLIIRGEGDPYLVSERLWLIAREVARSGIKEVTGGVKIDDSYFDSDPGDLIEIGSGQPYAAKITATSLNFNSLEIHVHPRQEDKKVFVELGPLPHNYGIIHNEVKLVKGTRRNVAIESEGMKDGKEIFRVYGEIGREAKPLVLYNSVEDTRAYFAYVFSAMLRQQGIKLGKDYAGPATKTEGTVIADLESLPLLELIRLANTYSNNFMAEQIFRMLGAKKFGAPATAEKSRKATQVFLNDIPECKTNSKVPNGSGLSWEGRVSALCFVKLMQKSYREFRGFADLVGSMPVGNSTGTLKMRFGSFGSWFDPWKVRAKTGTLWSKGAVTSLIGFVPSQNGELLTFAILLNNKIKSDAPIANMRQWEEQTVSFLQKLEIANDM